MTPLLQPVIGHGLDPFSREYCQNADEEAFDRRTERGFAGMARRWNEAHPPEPIREPRLGPPTWTIMVPLEAAGEQFSDPEALSDRMEQLRGKGHRITSQRNNL